MAVLAAQQGYTQCYGLSVHGLVFLTQLRYFFNYAVRSFIFLAICMDLII